MNKIFVVVRDKSFVFVLKVLFLLTFSTMMFAIFLSTFQHHHLSLDVFLNKIFDQNKRTQISLHKV